MGSGSAVTNSEKVVGQENEEEAVGSGLTGEDKGKGREEKKVGDERKMMDRVVVDDKASISTTTTTATTAQQPPPSILLHPLLSHPYLPAPIKLYIHLVRLLLVPSPILVAQGIPDNLDPILWMDTLIWMVGVLVVVVVGRKVGKSFGWGVGMGSKAGGPAAVVGMAARAGGGDGVLVAPAPPAGPGQANVRRPRHANPDQGTPNHVHLRRHGGAPPRVQGQQQPGGVGVGNPRDQPGPGAAGINGVGEQGGANPTQEPGLAGPLTTTTTTMTGRGDRETQAGLGGPRDDPAAVRRARAIAEERTQGI